MDNLRVLLVDDNSAFALEVENHVSNLGHEWMGVVENEKDALHTIQQDRPDLIIMSLQKKDERSVLNIARQAKYQDIPIIYSSYQFDQEIAQKSALLYPTYFLVHPIIEPSLSKALQMVASSLQGVPKRKDEKLIIPGDETPPRHYLIKISGAYQKMPIEDLLYVKGEGNYCYFHTSKKRFVVKMSLKKIFAMLDQNQFTMVHRAYIAQIGKIDTIDTISSTIKLANIDLPLGRKFKPGLLERFNIF